MPLTIAVDLDNTIVDHLGKQVRPGMAGLLERLRAAGYDLIVFTSSTRERALIILRDHDLERLFRRVVAREDYDPENLGIAKDLRAFDAHVLIDDHPGHVAFVRSIGLRGIQISNYRGGRVDPKELQAIERDLTGWKSRLRLWLKR
jgi:FMN phosphatase YigB (HAD superfamily)